MYLLKANLLLAMVWLFCRYVLGNDCHFSWRRLALMGGIALAVICPLLPVWADSPIHIVDLPDINIIGRGSDEYAGQYISDTVVDRSWHPGDWIIAVYLIVAGGLFVRMLIRLASIWMIVRSSRRDTIGYIPVWRISGEYGSVFSFFHYIFIPDGYSVEEYIISHELVHVRQLHSADVIIAELLTVVFWYNPAVWMLRREIRDNIEFLADAASVTKYNKHQYQMSLLSNISTKAIAKFYNNFNLSSIKRRIKMMNRKNSSTGAFRYLLALPVISLMFLVGCSGSNTSGDNNQSDNNQDEESTVVDEQSAETQVVSDTVTENLVYEKTVTEVVSDGDAAEFPGGYSEFMMFMAKNLVYPPQAAEDGVQGRVLVRFTVDKTGAVVNPQVVKGVRADLDSAAVSVIRKSPKWIPAPSGNDCTVNIPVNFKLQ